MKNIIIVCLHIFIIYGCSSPTSKNKKTNSKEELSNLEFNLNGTFSDYYSNKVYLNKIFESRLYPIDSTSIIRNKFNFKGIVAFPERYALTFENYSKSVVLIIENTAISIELDPKNMEDPIVLNSELNAELHSYKVASKNIFKQIDFLYPQFQKARLENDSEKLKEIGLKISIIENEHKTFTFDFILKHKNSYVSPMILRDQLKVSEIDTLKIIETYKLLNQNIKNSPDAQVIEQYFNISN